MLATTERCLVEKCKTKSQFWPTSSVEFFQEMKVFNSEFHYQSAEPNNWYFIILYDIELYFILLLTYFYNNVWLACNYPSKHQEATYPWRQNTGTHKLASCMI